MATATRQKPRRIPASSVQILLRVLVLGPVVIAPLLGGTAERPYTLAVAALGALAVLAAAALCLEQGQPLKVSFFTVALLVAVGTTLLQCVPLPKGLRAALAPGSDATLRQLVQDASGQPPSGALYLPLSVDPAATINEAARLLGYVSLLVALGTLLQRRGDSGRIGRVIYGSASLVAALGALAALGVPLPSLLAVPAGGATRALLPAAFYNSNHMAALLSVGAIVTVGAWRETASGVRRTLLALLLTLQDVALLGTLSRAGIVVGVAGQLAVLFWGRRETARPGHGPLRSLGRGPLWVALPLLAAAVLVAANTGLVAGLKARFGALDRVELLAQGSKVRAWLDALPLLRGHLALGVGRGAFEAAFASYQPLAESTRFVYLENQWLQAVVDWGVPAALCLGGLLALALRDAARGLFPRPGAGGPRSRVRVAALIAFIGLLIHNTVDFNLEVGGVAVAALALIALIERPRYALSPRWGAALAVMTLVSCAVAWRCPSQEQDGARLRSLAVADGPVASAAQVVEVGTQAVRRHPLDSYLYATVAARLFSDHQPAAVTWANRALIANPRDLGARRTIALILAQDGHRAQALRTLGLAITDGNRLQRQWLLQTAVAIAQTPSELLAVLPEAQDELPRGLVAGLVADELLELFGQRSETVPPWPVVRVVAEWGRTHGAKEALVWLGRACLAQRDTAAATQLLPELVAAQAPPLLVGDLLMLLVDTNHLDDAESLVPAALEKGRSAEVLLAAALLQERRGHLNPARSLLDDAQTIAERTPMRARVHEVRAELETRAGNLHRAELERQAAAQLQP